MARGCQLKLTTTRRTVTHALAPSPTFEFDFSSVLLLPEIDEVPYSRRAAPSRGMYGSMYANHVCPFSPWLARVHLAWSPVLEYRHTIS